jgi:hypothetical protein
VSLKTLANSASLKVSRHLFTVKQNSPVLLLGLGTVGMVASTVLACRATLKMSEILDEAETLTEIVDKDDNREVAEKAKMSVKLQTAVKIAKHYALPVGLGIVSLSAITGSHVVLQRRNTSLAAAYVTLDQMFKRYRTNVLLDQGGDKDREYRFGVVEKEIVDPETGLVETARGIDAEAVRDKEFSDYARMFDKYNDNWEPSPRQNLYYLQSVIEHFENVLRLRGYVFLNEIYRHMGYEITNAGQSLGWLKNDPDGDGYISFGIESDSENAVKFINGTISDVIIDFNVTQISNKLKRV